MEHGTLNETATSLENSTSSEVSCLVGHPRYTPTTYLPLDAEKRMVGAVRFASHSGQAWMQADEVVVPDSFRVPDSYRVKNLSEKSPDQGAELKRYRSVAAVPILVGRSNEVWGVVSVTTDRPNKFSTTSLDDDVAAQNVETVRILAKMIAVLVACCATSHKKASPSTTVESGGTDEAL